MLHVTVSLFIEFLNLRMFYNFRLFDMLSHPIFRSLGADHHDLGDLLVTKSVDLLPYWQKPTCQR